MPKIIKQYVTVCLIWIIMFLSFVPEIIRNTYQYDSNEMYWVQTAQILPLMFERKFNDPYWREFYGFTNFNGAKWVYAIGLRLFGYTEFSTIGAPPDAYLLWKKYENAPFPKTDLMYPMLFHARLISALVASGGISLMFLFTYFILTGNYYASLLSVILLRIHPITAFIASHALGDSMLFASEVFILLLLAKLFSTRNRTNTLLFILLGMALGYSASVKMNAALFYLVIITNFVIWKVDSRSIVSLRLRGFILVTIMAIGAFLALHPNFFFFPSYTPWQMITDRIRVTHSDLDYYSLYDPSHVLGTVSLRFMSMLRHVFVPTVVPFVILGLLGSVLLFFKRSKEHWRSYALQLMNALVVGLCLLSYVVFDEQRYFMPLLPFVCLIGSSWIEIGRNYISSLGRYWRASAT